MVARKQTDGEYQKPPRTVIRKPGTTCYFFLYIPVETIFCMGGKTYRPVRKFLRTPMSWRENIGIVNHKKHGKYFFLSLSIRQMRLYREVSIANLNIKIFSRWTGNANAYCIVSTTSQLACSRPL